MKPSGAQLLALRLELLGELCLGLELGLVADELPDEARFAFLVLEFRFVVMAVFAVFLHNRVHNLTQVN